MKTFLKRGALTVLPTALSIWILYSVMIALDEMGQKLIRYTGLEEPLRGTGFLLILVFLMIVGAMLSFRVSQWAYARFEKFLLNFPVISTIYGAIKDITNLVGSDEQNTQRTVLVKQANGTYMLGFVTTSELPPQISDALPNGEVWVSVMYPLSYQVAGVTNLVKETDLIYLDWDFEQAMKFVLTAGISKGQP